MANVFRRPPLDRLPTLDDIDAYFGSSPERSDMNVVQCGLWNTADGDFTDIEAVTILLVVSPLELIAVRRPTDGRDRPLPVMLLARGVSREEVDAKTLELERRTTPPIAASLDWLLGWEAIGRGLNLRRRPCPDHPHELLYG